MAELMSIHYRLGRHVWGEENPEFFERRFRHLFGEGDGQLDHLRALRELVSAHINIFHRLFLNIAHNRLSPSLP